MTGIVGLDIKALEKWFAGYSFSITSDDVATLRSVIDAAADERPVQKHLEQNPKLLASLLGGGHGRWVLPQCPFGPHIADFVIGDGDSAGFNWRFIELESPRANVFLKSGEFAESARHAIHQIKEWRGWVSRNMDAVRKRPNEGGMGLRWMEPTDWGIVLIGRSDDVEHDPADLRRQLKRDERIEMRTYDWLLDQLEALAQGTTRGPGGVVPFPPDDDRGSKIGLVGR